MRRRSSGLLALAFFAMGSWAVSTGCSAGAGSEGNLDPKDGSVLDGSDPDGSPTDGFGAGCDPACAATEICSVTRKCIPSGTCAADGDCKAGTICDPATKTCVPGGECGSEESGATAIPSNMLVVLDRSCSMTAKVGGVSKWQIAVTAMKNLTTKFKDKIRFGLTLFPDTVGPNCTQGVIPIPVAPGNEAKIDALLAKSLAAADPYFPDGPCVTNIDTAVEQAATEPAFKDTTRKSYALLITDGAQAGCSSAGGDAGTTKIITDMQKAGISTFVVGFGGAVDTASLNAFAVAGGVPSTDPVNKFYKAEDAASLDKAIATIGGTAAIGCTYVLSKTPPDPNKMFVFFGKTTDVPRDPTHTNGWDYDPKTNTITFYGTACADIKAGKVTELHVVFGCKKLPA